MSESVFQVGTYIDGRIEAIAAAERDEDQDDRFMVASDDGPVRVVIPIPEFHPAKLGQRFRVTLEPIN
jgi:hypothetical protein